MAADGHGCKVGAPSDGGLYFQFGSLIGWKGGATGNGKGMPDAAWNGKYWNGATAWSWNNDVMVVPTELSTKPTAWPNNNAANIETHNDFYFNYSKAPYATQFKNIRDYPGLASGALADKGIGDACSYYLGGAWRLPTAEEYKILCNNTTTDKWVDGKASWSMFNGVTGGYFSSNRLFFPASGFRNYTTGQFTAVSACGYGRSSSIESPIFGRYLSFGEQFVNAQDSGDRSYGFSVRCVSE